MNIDEFCDHLLDRLVASPYNVFRELTQASLIEVQRTAANAGFWLANPVAYLIFHLQENGQGLFHWTPEETVRLLRRARDRRRDGGMMMMMMAQFDVNAREPIHNFNGLRFPIANDVMQNLRPWEGIGRQNFQENIAAEGNDEDDLMDEFNQDEQRDRLHGQLNENGQINDFLQPLPQGPFWQLPNDQLQPIAQLPQQLPPLNGALGNLWAPQDMNQLQPILLNRPLQGMNHLQHDGNVQLPPMFQARDEGRQPQRQQLPRNRGQAQPHQEVWQQQAVQLPVWDVQRAFPQQAHANLQNGLMVPNDEQQFFMQRDDDQMERPMDEEGFGNVHQRNWLDEAREEPPMDRINQGQPRNMQVRNHMDHHRPAQQMQQPLRRNQANPQQFGQMQAAINRNPPVPQVPAHREPNQNNFNRFEHVPPLVNHNPPVAPRPAQMEQPLAREIPRLQHRDIEFVPRNPPAAQAARPLDRRDLPVVHAVLALDRRNLPVPPAPAQEVQPLNRRNLPVVQAVLAMDRRDLPVPPAPAQEVQHLDRRNPPIAQAPAPAAQPVIARNPQLPERPAQEVPPAALRNPQVRQAQDPAPQPGPPRNLAPEVEPERRRNPHARPAPPDDLAPGAQPAPPQNPAPEEEPERRPKPDTDEHPAPRRNSASEEEPALRGNSAPAAQPAGVRNPTTVDQPAVLDNPVPATQPGPIHNTPPAVQHAPRRSPSPAAPPAPRRNPARERRPPQAARFDLQQDPPRARPRGARRGKAQRGHPYAT